MNWKMKTRKKMKEENAQLKIDLQYSEDDKDDIRKRSQERLDKIYELEDENKKKDEEIKRLKSMIYSNTNSNSRYAKANELTSNIDFGNNSDGMQR